MARKILLADDSVTAQNMGRKILVDAGYEVIAVNNGSAALKKIAELKPDLVVLDVYMPGYSGLEVCQRVKESPDSSRIPVLLTVGKLEPFKPEEAQRVRADSYIVKPFEASELLSALAKLEDKVVPRSEPTKPGRFARAVAAAEEADRGRRNAPVDEGWKSRLEIHPKHAAEEAEDASATYNPVNRDLRTVVEAPAEKQSPTARSAEAHPEPSVDLTAVAPPGLPKDVTPEEVAAIAAAAAQIHVAEAASVDEPQLHVSAAIEPAPQPVPEVSPIQEAAQPSQSAEFQVAAVEAEIPAAPAVASEESDSDIPATMAASFDSAAEVSTETRWTAVPVALDSAEAAISLDQEMQKAQAADLAAQPATSSEKHADYQAAPSEPEFAIAQPQAEDVSEPLQSAPVAPSFEASPAIADASGNIPEPMPEAEAPVPFAQPEAMPVSSEPSDFVEHATSAADSVRADAEAALASHVHTDDSPAAPAAFTAALEAPAAPEYSSPTPSSEPVIEAAASKDSAEAASQPVPAEETRLDPEAVKHAAAAWATWRQIRDTHAEEDVHPAAESARDFVAAETSEPAPAARAVAAGAEQIDSEVAFADAEPKDVASIVDSVLADLRPKLMEEISRKMKKK